jgi:hypothetical protein
MLAGSRITPLNSAFAAHAAIALQEELHAFTPA